jgi:transcriptional regulator GlxA family with amidase domain
VLPQASILEVASALDPLRNANRQLGHEAFRWRVVTPDGAPAPLTCGLSLPSSGPAGPCRWGRDADRDRGLPAAGGGDPPADPRPAPDRAAFRLVGGVDAGPWVLARAGLLDGYRATVHWEDLEDLAAAHPEVEVVPDRFVIDRNRVTIGGAAPAADFMLHLIRSRRGAPWHGRWRRAS